MKPDAEHGNAQYDYAYSNEELETEDERKEKILRTIKDVTAHTAYKIAEAGDRMGSQARMPEFNRDLKMHNGFENPNPFKEGENRSPRPVRSARDRRK